MKPLLSFSILQDDKGAYQVQLRTVDGHVTTTEAASFMAALAAINAASDACGQAIAKHLGAFTAEVLKP